MNLELGRCFRHGNGKKSKNLSVLHSRSDFQTSHLPPTKSIQHSVFEDSLEGQAIVLESGLTGFLYNRSSCHRRLCQPRP
jgi:hypothetical protein